ncbi:unnamed protein product, partial [marine sediment metagenome]
MSSYQDEFDEAEAAGDVEPLNISDRPVEGGRPADR